MSKRGLIFALFLSIIATPSFGGLIFDGDPSPEGRAISKGSVVFLEGLEKFITSLKSWENGNFDKSVQEYKDFREKILDASELFEKILTNSSESFRYSKIDWESKSLDFFSDEELSTIGIEEKPRYIIDVLVITIDTINDLKSLAMEISLQEDMDKNRRNVYILSDNINLALKRSIFISACIISRKPPS